MPNEKDQPTALIEVRQLPIIAERLYSVKEQVELAVQEATSLVCTDETVQTVKNRRADLRKQFDELEAQRKAVKQAVLEPYNAFEKVYRECITEPFKRADTSLKFTIDEFEGELKARCRADLEAYFAELCAVHGVDYLTFDMALKIGNIKIALSDAKAMTPRKLQDALSMVVAQVADGAAQIARMDDAAEIMAEYKTCFDVGRSVSAVQERRRRVAQEQAEAENRERHRIAQEAVIAKVEALAPPEEEKTPHNAPCGPTEENEPTFEAFSFTVYNCTRSQLIKIREFLKQEGISYE